MPHSSGGGSHGGGSHGGSHGGGSSSRSSTYFSGAAHHYAYYKKGRVHHLYTKEPITPESVAKRRHVYKVARICWAIAYTILTAGLVLTLLTERATTPTTGYDDHHIYILDDAHIFTEEEKDDLYEAMERFREESNVTPCVLTVMNDEWKGRYVSLEKYAYDEYLNMFDDEMHWLLVYSTDNDPGWEDWYWEGMQGDDTDPVLTEYNTRIFRETFQKYLTKKNVSVADAFVKSFDTMLDGLYDRHVSIIKIILSVAFLMLHAGFVYLIIYMTTGLGIDDEAASFELPQPEKRFLEDRCQYCGGMFVHGIHISCPHCGGALPPAEGLVYVPDPGGIPR